MHLTISTAVHTNLRLAARSVAVRLRRGMPVARLVTVWLALVASAGVAQEAVPARAGISDLDWLAGAWMAEQRAVTVEERWTPAAGGAMLAVSRTVKGGRMVAFEYLRIVERDGGLIYVAQPNGRPATEFVLTALSPRAATFENREHDFPKVIHYAVLPDGRLEARVSDGATKEESFLFTRIP